MSRLNRAVKLIPLSLLLTLIVGVAAAGESAARPHMMYFYNPSCRMCTKTNEVVGAAEEKYKNDMTAQRFNIADPEIGTDNVLYLFDLLDAMAVPASDNTITLAVFLGTMEVEDGEEVFTPKRVLIEGEEIIPKLDTDVGEFLKTEGKGGKSLGLVRPAGFFLHHRAGVADAS